MKTRRLGASDLEVSEISFGSWLTVAGGVERRQSERCIAAAYDHGVRFFDTANVYGFGHAETVLGATLQGRPRDSYILATKVFYPMPLRIFGIKTRKHVGGLSKEKIAQQLNDSLKRLRTDYLDLYYCHRYDSETPLEETMEALTAAVKAGKVRYLGLSEWTPEQIEAAAALSAGGQLAGFVASQPQYSLLWRKPEAQVFAVCARHGISQIAFSPLAQGVLTGKYLPGAPPPQGSRAANNKMNMFMESKGRRFRAPDLLAAVQQLNPIAKELGLTPSQLALAWVLRRPEVASAVIGATRPEQIADNAKASGVVLPAEALAQIEEALDPVAIR